MSVMSFKWLSQLESLKSSTPLATSQSWLSCRAAACGRSSRCCSGNWWLVSGIVEAPRLQRTSAPLWSESSTADRTWPTPSRTRLSSAWFSSSAKAVGVKQRNEKQTWTLSDVPYSWIYTWQLLQSESVREISSPGQTHCLLLKDYYLVSVYLDLNILKLTLKFQL